MTVQAESIFQSAKNMHTVCDEIRGTTPDNIMLTVMGEDGTEAVLTLPGEGGDLAPPPTFVTDVKQDVKSRVLMEVNEHSLKHIQSLIKQGRFLELTQLEQTDATWKSFICNLPKGTMKFVLNASLDTLPTKANLSLWGKRTNVKCRCGVKETLNHILNCCQLALTEGRFTFRHDCVLNYIASCLDTDKYTCYVDIPGHQTPAGGTLPPDVAVTNLKPDIVIVDRRNRKSERAGPHPIGQKGQLVKRSLGPKS